MRTKASKLDSYGKFKIDKQKEFKNNVWTSFPIINDIKTYIKNNNLTFKTALDPCAGSCRLIKEFNEYDWTGYEINETIVSECVEEDDLKKLVKICDFLKTDIVDHFDLCICNPPYNNNGGINNWVKKILKCCDMLFLIVPYNFITKISQQKKLIDVIHVENGMDESYHTCIKVYIFNSQAQEEGFYEKPENSLFYLNKHIKKHKTDQVIYLRDYLNESTIKPKAKLKIDTIPTGTKYPVYTLANNPVKYTDTTNCPGNVVLLNHSYLASCNPLKYSFEECYLNETFGVYTVKEELKEEFMKMLFCINIYLHELFKMNNVNVVLKREDLLNIPIFINPFGREQILNDALEEHLKRFKFYNLIKSKNIEWL